MSSRDAVSVQTIITVAEDKGKKHTDAQQARKRNDLDKYTLVKKVSAHKEKEDRHYDVQEEKIENKSNASAEKNEMSSDDAKNAEKQTDGPEKTGNNSDCPVKNVKISDAPKDGNNSDAPESNGKKFDALESNGKKSDATEKERKMSDASEKTGKTIDAQEEILKKSDSSDYGKKSDGPEKTGNKSDCPQNDGKKSDAPEKDVKKYAAPENDGEKPHAPENGVKKYGVPEKYGEIYDTPEKDGNKPDGPEQREKNKHDAPKEKEVKMNEKVMKFDDALKKVGSFGLYQKRLLIIACLTGGCVILQNNSPVITMKTPAHRCKIPGYVNDTFKVQSSFHENLVDLHVPKGRDGKYSQCTRYDVTDADDAISPGNTSMTVECTEWVYDRSTFTETLVSQLDLVCDRKIYRSHSSMMIFAGKFVGAFLSSIAGDYFGRRRVYTVMLIGMLSSALGLVFVDTLPALMALRFFIGGTTTGCYLCVYVIGMELLGLSQRRWTSLAFKVCEISMSLMAVLCAYLLRDWHHYQATLAAPCVLVIAGYLFLPESPRWLMTKGRLEEAQKIIDEVARINGVRVPPKLEAVLDAEGVPGTAIKAGNIREIKEHVSPVRLFRVPRLAVRYTLLYFCWIFIIMCMYGLMLNVSNMSGNIFINFALMSGVDVLSMVIYAALIERVGRRLLLVGVTSLGGLACLATILPTVLGGSSWILRVLSIVGRMGITTAMATIYVMSPELFPTVLRSFGLGSCSMFARLGGLAAPYVADLNTYVHGTWGPALPQVVFGVAGVTTAGMVLTLPETRGRHLPETVKDAEHFGSINETATSKDEKA